MMDYRAYAVARIAAALLPQPPTPPKGVSMESHAYIASGDGTFTCPRCGRCLRLRPGTLFEFDVLTPGNRSVNHVFSLAVRDTERDEPPAWLAPLLRDIERGVV